MDPVGLPSTFFTMPPEWRWYIVFYFFLGGIAGGSYFLAALIDFLGWPQERPLARIGYYLALPLTIVCAVLLILDLNRPDRFWHMLLQSETWLPMFKWWSPMSIGSWALLVFGAFATVSFLAALADAGRLHWRWLSPLRPPRLLGSIIVGVGALLGLFVAGYTGVLLAVTNRPIWADNSLLGLVFLLSGVSTAAALIILLGHLQRWTATGIEALARLDGWILIFELLALGGLVISIWSMLPQVWFNAWGLILLVGVFLAGIVVPLALEWRPHAFAARTAIAAVLVLIGGFLLRVVLLLSSESISIRVVSS